MTKIENEQQYEALMKRVEYLMMNLSDDLPADDPRMVELSILGNMVADYSDAHYSVGEPTLIETIRLRMYERGLNQTALASLLGISPSRVSELLSGKKEPTLRVGRLMAQKLDIDPAIILGV